MNNFERIKNMTVEELAEYLASNSFPSSPCYVCEYDEGVNCIKEGFCPNEYREALYAAWLISE